MNYLQVAFLKPPLNPLQCGGEESLDKKIRKTIIESLLLLLWRRLGGGKIIHSTNLGHYFFQLIHQPLHIPLVHTGG